MTEDEKLREFLKNNLTPERDPLFGIPTILSLQDTINLLVKNVGPDWIEYPECKCCVIWSSKRFKKEHVKEVAPPEILDLCMEYRKTGKVYGNEFPDDFIMLAIALVTGEFKPTKELPKE